ncbi:MAG: metallophosphoesterase [Nitriliruptoraceae bacterium]
MNGTIARLAVVTDVHYGPPVFTKRGETAPALMHDFAQFVAEANVSHVLDLGDRINDVDHATDRSNMAEVAQMFRQLPKPCIHINGNHDVDQLTVRENEELLGVPLGHETLDIGGWRIVVWRVDSRIYRSETNQSGFSPAEEDTVWLARTLQNADRPCLVIAHVPFSGRIFHENYYFKHNPEISTYPTSARMRAALQLATVPVVVLTGHVHENSVTTVGGITHLTQQSLTESFTTGGAPAAAMGVIELGQTVTWTVVGRDPIQLTFTPTVTRWVPPLPCFTDTEELRVRRDVPRVRPDEMSTH